MVIGTVVVVGLPVELAENLPVVCDDDSVTVVDEVVVVWLLYWSSRATVNGMVGVPLFGAVKALDVNASLVGGPGLMVSTCDPGAKLGALAPIAGEPANSSP